MARDTADLGPSPTGASAEPDSISEVLRKAIGGGAARISLDDLVSRLGAQATGALFVILAAPSILPLPPGSGTIAALPLLFITPQLAVGRKTLWLPRRIGRFSLDRKKLSEGLEKAIPRLRKVEDLARPRLCAVTRWYGRLAIGVSASVLAIILVLPIPFANLLPGLALAALGLALARKDGVFALIGHGLTVATLAWIAVGIHFIGEGAERFVHAFSF